MIKIGICTNAVAQIHLDSNGSTGIGTTPSSTTRLKVANSGNSSFQYEVYAHSSGGNGTILNYGIYGRATVSGGYTNYGVYELPQVEPLPGLATFRETFTVLEAISLRMNVLKKKLAR